MGVGLEQDRLALHRSGLVLARLAGESEETVFPEEEKPVIEPLPEPESEKKPVLKPQPRTIPGAAMQPPPPDPAAS